MAKPESYETHFKVEQQLKIAIRLSDSKYLYDNGVVREVHGNLLTIELFDEQTAKASTLNEGAQVVVSGWSSWALCRCDAKLEKKDGEKKELILKLQGKVDEQQRREFFRLDVFVPILYTVPEVQNLSDIDAQWQARLSMSQQVFPVMASTKDGFKVVNWRGHGDVPPQRVNLSGGGIRLKTSESFESGRMVNIDIFLPVVPPRVISVVAEALRSSEIMLTYEKGAHFTTAFRFHRLDEKDRETIISYLFGEQRQLLRTQKGEE